VLVAGVRGQLGWHPPLQIPVILVFGPSVLAVVCWGTMCAVCSASCTWHVVGGRVGGLVWTAGPWLNMEPAGCRALPAGAADGAPSSSCRQHRMQGHHTALVTRQAWATPGIHADRYVRNSSDRRVQCTACHTQVCLD
jgi:hypothetical protein